MIKAFRVEEVCKFSKNSKGGYPFVSSHHDAAAYECAIELFMIDSIVHDHRLLVQTKTLYIHN
jgi:hypothetical protein